MLSLRHFYHPECTFLEREPLQHFAHFKAGGPAELLAIPHSREAVVHIARQTIEQNVPLYVVGQMSNILVSDEGLPGVVMLLGQSYARTMVQGTVITAESGIWLSRLASLAAQHRLSGLSFASGIPGTLGGSILINAGAYDGQFDEIVATTTFMDAKGNIERLSGKEHQFAYRHSRFVDEPGLILSSSLQLTEDGQNEYDKMAELAMKRRHSQPLACPSCGSAFKRPTGYYAGKLIADSGLKGYTYQGASVSNKHAGFIVNDGGANASQITAVFIHVQDEVKKQTGVVLEPEVRFAGHFDHLPEHAHRLKPLFG